MLAPCFMFLLNFCVRRKGAVKFTAKNVFSSESDSNGSMMARPALLISVSIGSESIASTNFSICDVFRELKNSGIVLRHHLL